MLYKAKKFSYKEKRIGHVEAQIHSKLPKFSFTGKYHRLSIRQQLKPKFYTPQRFHRFDENSKMPPKDLPQLLNQIALKTSLLRKTIPLSNLLPLSICVEEKIKELISEAEKILPKKN